MNTDKKRNTGDALDDLASKLAAAIPANERSLAVRGDRSFARGIVKSPGGAKSARVGLTPGGAPARTVVFGSPFLPGEPAKWRPVVIRRLIAPCPDGAVPLDVRPYFDRAEWADGVLTLTATAPSKPAASIPTPALEKSPPIDFVWLYIDDPAEEDELRWSIRSVLKNYRGNARVWIVGDRPDWYDGNYIPVERLEERRNGKVYRHSRRDRARKFAAVADCPDISETFVAMQDDIYLLERVGLAELSRPYVNGKRIDPDRDDKDRNTYEKQKTRTAATLRGRGVCETAADYGTHTPKVYKRSELKRWLHEYEMHKKPLVCTVLFGNLQRQGETVPVGPVRCRFKKTPDDLRQRSAGKLFLNHEHGGWSAELRQFLKELFPDASPYEKNPAPVPAVAAQPFTLEDVTVGITYHPARPGLLERVKTSARVYFPNIKIEEEAAGTAAMSRNRLAERIKTPLIMLCEDDFIFTSHTRLDKLVAVLNADPAVGAACGSAPEPQPVPGVWDGNRGKSVFWYEDFFKTADDLYFQKPRRQAQKAPALLGTRPVEYRPCDVTVYAGVYRTDMLRALPHPEEMLSYEHISWYYSVYRDARWHFAYVPGVSIDHVRSRNKNYSPLRNRRCKDVEERLIGGTMHRRRVKPDERPDNSCVVVLGTGRSLSSFYTAALARMEGLHMGRCHGHSENAAIFKANRRARPGGTELHRFRPELLNVVDLRRALRAMPRPWIIKDPAFCEVLSADAWKDALAEFSPRLVWLTRNTAATQASLDRRGWGHIDADARHERAALRFLEWDGPKQRIRSEDIAEGFRGFNPDRVLKGAK